MSDTPKSPWDDVENARRDTNGDPVFPPVSTPKPGVPLGPDHRLHVRHRGPNPEPRAFIGLDLGQRQDHSALALLDLRWKYLGRCAATYQWVFQPCLTLRGLHRFPLNTSYLVIQEMLIDFLDDIDARSNGAVPARRELIIDAGGPGGPMVDWLRRSLPRGVELKPVIITSGHSEGRHPDGFYTIPRRTLITELILMVNYRTITIPPGLDHWEDFVAEMVQLRGESGHPVAGGHDDLVMSVSLGANAVCKVVPELRPAFRGRKRY